MWFFFFPLFLLNKHFLTKLVFCSFFRNNEVCLHRCSSCSCGCRHCPEQQHCLSIVFPHSTSASAVFITTFDVTERQLRGLRQRDVRRCRDVVRQAQLEPGVLPLCHLEGIERQRARVPPQQQRQHRRGSVADQPDELGELQRWQRPVQPVDEPQLRHQGLQLGWPHVAAVVDLLGVRLLWQQLSTRQAEREREKGVPVLSRSPLSCFISSVCV